MKGGDNMKQVSYRRGKVACLLLLVLFLLSVLDKNPEMPSPDEVPYLGYTQTASVPCVLEEDTGIIPDFINAEETFYAGHAVVLSRSTVRRLTNTRADLTCHEATGYGIFCILLTLMLFYLTAAFLCSRQFIIRYIHDQDGQKNKLLYSEI